MIVSGIYRIVCRKNGRYYYGSSNNIQKRWWTHKNYLKKNKHSNIFLQRAWNKYGESSFVFELVESVTNDDMLLLVEQVYLSNHVGKSNCMNMKETAGGGLTHRKHDRFVGNRKGKIPWNKGLRKETDKRIANASILLSEKRKAMQVVPWNKGRTSIYSKSTLTTMRERKLNKPNPSRAKLTEYDVRAIREGYVKGETLVALGKIYKVSPDTVSQITKRKTWKHVLP